MQGAPRATSISSTLFAQTSPHNLVQSYIHTIKHTRFYVGIDLATANKTTNFITIDTLVDRNHPGNPVNDNTLIINCKNNTSTSLVWFQFILSLTISTPQTANPGSFHLISSSISTSRPLGKAKRLYLQAIFTYLITDRDQFYVRLLN